MVYKLLIDKSRKKRYNQDEYFLYYGFFDENGRKSDKNALFYSSSDRLIKGEILNDNFIEGYVAFFNSETGYLTNFNFCKFGIDGTVTNVKQETKTKE